MEDAVIRAVASRLVDPEYRRTEADIQASVRDLLVNGGLDLDDAHVRLEAPAPGQGRIDVQAGATVIEVKKDLARAPRALDQLAGYLADREDSAGTRLVGVLTDGVAWRAYRLADGARDGAGLIEAARFDLSRDDPDGRALLVWLDGILATTQAITPTPREVADRLGATSSATRLDLTELDLVYAACADDPAVQLKRELWARLLTTAFGTSFDADDTGLFLEHTYLVVLAKMVAHAAVGEDLTAGRYEPDELLAGRLFSEIRIFGVVESDFFDWPADTEAGRAWIANLARRVARFQWHEVRHDVLKVLYESVIGRDTRHALGEYYTPDWLAKALVGEVVDDPLRQSVLDPGCGSGTFLYWSVRRCVEACETAGMTAAETISRVTGQVYGIDVHPVAVALARVTYLLAIGVDRLGGERPSLSVPVWLGDSVQFQRRDDLRDADALTVHTTDGTELYATELRFPDRVVDNIRWFDALVREMTERAAARSPGDPVPTLRAVYDRNAVHAQDRAVLDATMSALCRLCDEGRDSIWGYYVRNEARPRWLSRPENRVDRLVGNPPWLAYRHMTERMQARFREMSEERGLWHGQRVATHQDLSALFVARTTEQFLKPGGRFAYLMPLAVLTRQAYQGFRSGRWVPSSGRGAATTVAFDVPWDLHDITPRIFPVPPAAVLATRTQQSPRPLAGKAQHWSGRQPGGLDSFDSLTVEEVPLVQMPSDDDNWSPYRTRFFQGATLVPRSLALVEPAGASRLGTAAGTVAVRAARSARERPPWRDLPDMSGVVEDRFVFGVHLGPTVYAFRSAEPLQAVLPWTGERLLAADDPELDRWPGFASWWREANRRWEAHRPRSGAEMDLGGYFDWHGKLAAQADHLDELRVVYTKSGQYLAAAIVTDTRTVIDHKLYWCRAGSLDEARYVTAVLNAPVLGERVAPLQARGEHNPRDIDKYVWALPIPRYDHADRHHARLAKLAERGEQVAAEVDLTGVRFETGRKRVREALVAAGVAAELDAAVDHLLLDASAVN